jgi:hypothetical protein
LCLFRFVVALSFGYAFFLRTFAGCLVWTSIFGVLFGTVGCGVALLDKERQLKEAGTHTEDTLKAMRAAAYLLIIFAAIFLLVILFLRY